MCPILNKLEELTPSLPPVYDLSKYNTRKGKIANYVFDSGTVVSESIYATPDIGIAKTFIKKGVTFDIHKHEISGEWLIILHGMLTVVIDGKETTLNKYDSIKIDAKKPHFAIAVEDTTFIAITVPKDDGFPE